MTAKTICIIGTLDTKGEELLYLKKCIQARGMNALVMDCGVFGPAPFPPEISADAVAEAAGQMRAPLAASGDPGRAVAAMSQGAAVLTARLYHSGRIQGAISMGGGQGTCIGAAALRTLPFGFPKVMVSTIAMLDKAPFAGLRDTLVMDPVLDISGLNSVLKAAIENAAGAICGMTARWKPVSPADKPRIGITMYGATTACASRVSALLQAQGYETLMFHANGIGGNAMEELIEAGVINAVADLTLTEVGQRHLGGLCAGNQRRMEAAGRLKLPQVVVPGAVDCVNFSTGASIPEQYRTGRLFHRHNSATTLMRTNPEENRQIGGLIAEKLNRAEGPVLVFLPRKGLSAYDKEGCPFYDPLADKALFESLRHNLRQDIPVKEADCHINDPVMAEMIAAALGPLVTQ